MWNAKYKKPHGNTVRLALQAQSLTLSNNTLFRLHFQSEHLKAFFAPKFRVVVSVLPVWVRLWVKWENGGKLNLPPHYCFRTLTHIFQQLMWSTQNEKTELITQKSRLKRRLFKVFLVGVRGLEPRVSCSQTYREYFFYSFIAVFSHFLFVLLTLWRSYLRCFRVFRSRLW